jgi:seryl-tRNA synthetase
MLDPAYVRDHSAEVRAGLGNRGLDPDTILGPFAELDARRKKLIPEVEGLKREQNASGEEVARAKREGRTRRASSRRTRRAGSGSRSSRLSSRTSSGSAPTC